MIRIERKDLALYFRQTLDYVFLDSVEVEAGIKAVGDYKLPCDGWFFSMHFPGDPTFPGVFQMECLQQTGAIIINTIPGREKRRLYFYGCQDIRIRKQAIPGSRLHMNVIMKRFRRGVGNFRGWLYVDGELSLEMEFTLVDPDDVMLRR